jgi:signal-transduction protein with cAMP-binding, CBS, and nucleotidyltransferase domain
MNRTAGDILRAKHANIIDIGPDGTLREALKKMTENRVGAILIKENDEYVGIWTERDLMYHTLQEDFDIDKARIRDYMTSKLIKAEGKEQVYQLYDKFLGRRIRHLLIEEEGRFIGMLSIGDVVKASLQQKIEEYKELNEMVSLEYYENWKTAQAERT